MSIERELLNEVLEYFDPLGLNTEHCGDLPERIKKLLAQPEQQPEAWIIVNRDTGYRIQVSLFPDLYNKDMFEVIPLYTTPPKQEPLNATTINYYLEAGFEAGVKWAEKVHGIGGGE